MAISEKMAKQLDNNFMYHAPKEDQPQRYTEIRSGARMYAEWVCNNAPESRELSLFLTKLEEAVFWANAAIARNE